MGMGSGEGSGGGRVRGLVVKALVLVGGVLLLKRLSKSATRWDHARAVAEALSGEKFSREQACRDPDSYFNIRMLTCPASDMVDGSRVLYFEQAFWRTPQKPFRQRFYMVKPCPKEMRCDVELSSYAIRDMEEYINFCDRPKDQRPQTEEVIADIAEHLTTIHLSRCERGERCLYKGSTAAGGCPNFWNGSSYSTTEVTIYKNGEIHTWDRGYNEEGNQVWGPKGGPYEFKPAPTSSLDDMFSPLNFPPTLSLEKKISQPEGPLLSEVTNLTRIVKGLVYLGSEDDHRAFAKNLNDGIAIWSERHADNLERSMSYSWVGDGELCYSRGPIHPHSLMHFEIY